MRPLNVKSKAATQWERQHHTCSRGTAIADRLRKQVRVAAALAQLHELVLVTALEIVAPLLACGQTTPRQSGHATIVAQANTHSLTVLRPLHGPESRTQLLGVDGFSQLYLRRAHASKHNNLPQHTGGA